jgi:hypothetical protein
MPLYKTSCCMLVWGLMSIGPVILNHQAVLLSMFVELRKAFSRALSNSINATSCQDKGLRNFPVHFLWGSLWKSGCILGLRIQNNYSVWVAVIRVVFFNFSFWNIFRFIKELKTRTELLILIIFITMVCWAKKLT